MEFRWETWEYVDYIDPSPHPEKENYNNKIYKIIKGKKILN